MKASASLKAACLTVGLATAWSPVLSQKAHADTIDVSLNIGTSADPGSAFDHVYVGLLFSDFMEIHSIAPDGGGAFPFGVSDTQFDSIHSIDASTQFVVFGVTPFSGEVMASVAPAAATSIPTWGDLFGSTNTEFDESKVFTALGLGETTFLSDMLSASLATTPVELPPNLLAGFYDTGTLVDFGNGGESGGVSLTLENLPDDNPPGDNPTDDPQPVPLPAGVMMGGVLLSLVFTGKVTRAWMSSREVPGLV